MRKTLSLLTTAILLLSLCTGCGRKGPAEEYITSLEQLDDSRYTIGIGTGTASARDAADYFTRAHLVDFSSQQDAYLSVQMGKLDAFAFSRVNMEYAIASGGLHGVALLEENVGNGADVVVGISRKAAVPDLQQKVNSFINAIHSDGTFDEAYNRWIVEAQEEMPELPIAEHPDCTIRIGTAGTVEPFTFYKGDQLIGLDVELLYRFAYYINADVDIQVIDFFGLLSAAESGTIDCIFANLNATPERAEIMDFSVPIYRLETGIMVRSPDPASPPLSDYDGQHLGVITGRVHAGFWHSLADSFEKTFVREQRWKLIMKGIGTTIFIAIFSSLFGTVLGFGLCLLRRLRRPLLFRITSVYIRILQGTPLVVLLMVLYYLVFPHSGLPGEWVAIIAFSLNFAAYVSEIIRAGIDGVDIGQTEAALALGFTKRRAFLHFILPQAAQSFLPVYKGEFISLVKMTSIVGYIAVQDLTKMSDIIRARTYEAFFPLISTALIYFLISAGLSSLLRLAEIRITPDRRNRMVKGVKMQ